MQRRTFVRSAGAAAVTPMLAACARTAGFSIDDMVAPSGSLPSGSVARAHDPDGVWSEGLAYARWAPSPHNTQPWRLHIVSRTEAEVFYDPQRLLPVLDPTSAFTIIGLSMFVDYLSIAVRPRGFEVVADFVQVPLDYTAKTPVRCATLALVPAGEGDVPDRRLILQRKTSRLPYDNRPVEGRAMDALACVAREHGSELKWSSNDTLVRWAIDLNRATLYRDLDDGPSRAELRRWIRTTDEEAASHKDGLWAQCLRMPGWLLRAFFDDHDRWGHGWRASIGGEALANSMNGTRTIAWWSGPFDGPPDWIAAGRMLGRTWLELTRRGVQMHPFGSVITNAGAHAQLVKKVGATEGAHRLWLLARLGRSETPPRSYRIPAADILLSQEQST